MKKSKESLHAVKMKEDAKKEKSREKTKAAKPERPKRNRERPLDKELALYAVTESQHPTFLLEPLCRCTSLLA